MKLNIKSMVISVSSAVFLKKKGVKQESLYYWMKQNGEWKLLINPYHAQLIKGEEIDIPALPANAYSAFLSDELILALKKSKSIKLKDLDINVTYRKFFTVSFDINQGWSLGDEIVGTVIFTEEQEKENREQGAKRAPQSPKNPKTNDNNR